MSYRMYEKMEDLARRPEALEQTLCYLTERMRVFLKPQERVLICYPDQDPQCIGGLIAQAVQRVGGIPQLLEPDFRWKTMLRQCFASRATAIMGPPLVVLGLAKLARYTATPLFIRNVLLAGYPSMDWMVDGIRKTLDCQIWGCYGPGVGAVVGGFSCCHSRGIHVRDDAYTLRITDERGSPLPDGTVGEVVVSPTADPSVSFASLERGRLERKPCACGNPAPRLMDIGAGRYVDKLVAKLGSELLAWTSILDCRIKRGEYGLELEIVTFPGEKLPKLPSCAKLVVRHWDPETDQPAWVLPDWKKRYAVWEND